MSYEIANSLEALWDQKFGLNNSLEDDTINIEVNTGEDDNEEESAAASVVEVQEADIEVQDDLDTAEELEDTIDALESLYRSIESAGEDGMSPETAAMAETAMAVIVGDEITEQIMPSNESFVDDRKASTVNSLEAVGAGIKAAAKRFLELLMKAWASVKNFMMNIFSSAGRIKLRAQRIMKKAGDVKQSDAKSDAKVTTSAAKTLHVNGKTSASATEIIKTWEEGVSLARTYNLDSIDSQAGKTIPLLTIFASDSKKDGYIKKVADAAEHPAAAKLTIQVKGSDTEYRSNYLFNNNAVVVKKFEKEPGLDTLGAQLKGSIPVIKKTGDAKVEDKELPLLTMQQVQVVAKGVADLMDAIQKKSNAYKSEKAYAKESKNSLNKMAKVEETKEAKAAAKALASFNYAVIASETGFDKYNITVSSAMLNYAAASMKVHNGGKSDAADKKADESTEA